MHKARVLYVDDDEDSREMLRMLLEMRSIETKAVGTAGESLSSIQAEHLSWTHEEDYVMKVVSCSGRPD